MALAEFLAAALGLYAGIGIIFAGWFVVFAVDRFDPAARGTGAGFRALILPGVAALWPFICLLWMRRGAAHD